MTGAWGGAPRGFLVKIHLDRSPLQGEKLPETGILNKFLKFGGSYTHPFAD